MKTDVVKMEIAMEFVVGAFLVVAVLGMVWFTIILSQQNIFSKKMTLRIDFEEVMGIREGDNIVVRGMPVGKVKELVFRPDGQAKVRVIVNLDKELTSTLNIRQDYKVTIVTTSILGGRYIELFEGTLGAPALLLAADTVLVGDRPVDLMREASDVIHQVKNSLERGGILTNLEVTVAEIRSVAEKIDNSRGTLGRLVNEDSLYTNLEAVVANVKDSSARLSEIADRVNRGEGTLGKLLKDDTVYNDVQRIAENLKGISQRLADGEGTLGKLMSKDDTLYKDLSETAASLKNITTRIDRGEGLLGKITKDDELYDEAKSAIKELRAAIDDFRETAPVVSFSSLLFGAL